MGVTFGEFLRSERAARKMSLRDVAEVAGVSAQLLSSLERGEPVNGDGSAPRPKYDTVISIARALGVVPSTALQAAGYTTAGTDDVSLGDLEALHAMRLLAAMTPERRRKAITLLELVSPQPSST